MASDKLCVCVFLFQWKIHLIDLRWAFFAIELLAMNKHQDVIAPGSLKQTAKIKASQWNAH